MGLQRVSDSLEQGDGLEREGRGQQVYATHQLLYHVSESLRAEDEQIAAKTGRQINALQVNGLTIFLTVYIMDLTYV